jgi:hypothetical protein
MHEKRGIIMTTISLFFCLFLILPPGWDVGPLWTLIRQNIKENSSAQDGSEKALWEKRFEIHGIQYLAQVNDGLIVRNISEKAKGIIYQFKPDYNYACGRESLILATLNKGQLTCFAWKWCKGHDCPFMNGAILVDVLNRKVFRLEYEWKQGITLSSNLAPPENKEIRDWLIAWWEQWPGRDVPVKAISYKHFERTQKPENLGR